MKKCMIVLAGFILLLAGCPRIEGGGKPSPTVTEYTVTFSHAPKEGGSLTAKVKNGAPFTSGKTVLVDTVLEFIATPKSGYKVEKWEGVAANPKDSTKATLKVTKDANVKVFFVKNSTEPSEPPSSVEKYTVTYSHTPSEGGSLTAKVKNGGSFISGTKAAENTVLEFTAEPASNYSVGKWSGEGLKVSSDKKTATLKVSKAVNVTVTFVTNGTPTPPPTGKEYKVTYSHTPDEGGNLTAKRKDSGDSVASGSNVPENTIIEFTAAPKDGYRVKEWTGATVSAGDKTKATLIVTGNAEVKVVFEAIPKYKVDFTADSNGTITAKKITDGAEITTATEVYEGTKIEFTAIPTDGFKVEKWEGDGLTVSAGKKTATLTVQKNVTVKVTFTVAQKHTITFSAEPAAGGTIAARRKDNGELVTSRSLVDEEREIIFTATPAAATESSNGYYILRWSGEDLKVSSDKKTAELTVKKDTEVKVMFQKYLIQNPNWEAVGILKTKDGTMKKFHMVINDGSKYFSFFDQSHGGETYLADMTYDKSTTTITLQGPLGEGTIRFVSMKDSTPSEWEIDFLGVKAQSLELPDQTVKVEVTLNDNSIS